MASPNASPEDALDELQLDALREVANIGCGHAVGALSRLMGGQRVGIEVPRAKLIEFGAIAELVGGHEEPVVGVATDITGELGGGLLLLMPVEGARGLAGALLGARAGEGPLSDEARSALSEVGNILCSACLSAIATAFGLSLLPSVPRLAEDMAGAVLEEVVSPMSERADRALVLETRFSAGDGQALSGHFLIFPDVPSLPALLKAIGL